MRFTQVGYISDITTNSGTTNGKEWKKTRFKLSVLEYMSREGKNVVRRYWVNTFNNVSVSDGPAMLNLDVVNRKTGRKSENGNDIYELALDANAVEMLEIAGNNEVYTNEEEFQDDDIPF